ncbi:hypothetical protein M2401_004264 [Pseudomonas sp. JUb42]|jgi:hypothetical protein|nr:hypothetical protein [Pseudomonas sp. JUb42]
MVLLLMSMWSAAIAALILFAVYRSKARMRSLDATRDKIQDCSQTKAGKTQQPE